MSTAIHLSNKLEKILASKIDLKDKNSEENIYLGKWNATIFYSERKKCLLITNAKTKFSVIVFDIKTADFKNLSNIIIDNIYSQIIYEGIFIEFKELEKWIGKINFHKTDNDSKTIGILNYNIRKIKDWRIEYPLLKSFEFREIAKKLNAVPFKIIDWNLPNEKMKQVITTGA